MANTVIWLFDQGDEFNRYGMISVFRREYAVHDYARETASPQRVVFERISEACEVVKVGRHRGVIGYIDRVEVT